MSCYRKDEFDRSALGHKREHNVEFVSSTENRSISSWKAKSSLENNDGRRKESFQRGMDLRSYFLDERLTPAEKILLAEIDSLTSDDRGCYASNAHFAKRLAVTESRANHIVARLTRGRYLIP